MYLIFDRMYLVVTVLHRGIVKYCTSPKLRVMLCVLTEDLHEHAHTIENAYTLPAITPLLPVITSSPLIPFNHDRIICSPFFNSKINSP
jgi:hypothetical protein